MLVDKSVVLAPVRMTVATDDVKLTVKTQPLARSLTEAMGAVMDSRAPITVIVAIIADALLDCAHRMP